jgi:hypothetical protein
LHLRLCNAEPTCLQLLQSHIILAYSGENHVDTILFARSCALQGRANASTTRMINAKILHLEQAMRCIRGNSNSNRTGRSNRQVPNYLPKKLPVPSTNQGDVITLPSLECKSKCQSKQELQTSMTIHTTASRDLEKQVPIYHRMYYLQFSSIVHMCHPRSFSYIRFG